MARMDYEKAKRCAPSTGDPRPLSTKDILKGMGKGRYSKAAGGYMGREKSRRIDPNSPEGRAIAARYT